MSLTPPRSVSVPQTTAAEHNIDQNQQTPASETEVRTYLLDTSVLLSDPHALLRFAEHKVVLPIVVISELEKKRHDPELGYFARSALRLLDDLRVQHGSLNQPVPLNDEGGQLVVELNHISVDVLPYGFRGTDNDSRILAVAQNLSDEGERVTVVSKDLPMRVKASSMGLEADEYRNELVKSSGWTGLDRLDVTDEQLSQLYSGENLLDDRVAEMPINTGLVLNSVLALD